MKRILITILLFSLIAEAEPRRRLTWEKVEGALGYYIEIKNSEGNTVVSEMINNNYYDVLKLEPGEYTFRIASVNVLMQRGESTEWIDFTVEKLFIPELKSISRKELIATVSNRNINIRGVNFNPASRFFLRGKGTEIELDDIDLISDREVVLTFKPSSSQIGSYDLAVVNRGDVEAVLRGAVIIVEPEKAESIYYLGASYSVNMPMGDFPEYFSTSFTGGGLFLQTPALMFGYENVFFEGEVDAVRYFNTPDTRKCSLTCLGLGFGGGYIYPVSAARVEVILKFLTGPIYSVLVMDEKTEGKEVSSIDWAAMLGAGIRYYPGSNYFIEPGCGWKTVFYKGTWLHDVRFSLGGGMKI